MQKNINDIVIFLVAVSLLVLILVIFIIIILCLYRKKQILFKQNLEQIKSNHEKTLMAAQLEIQESTLQHISREIHDNINLSLTMAKLQLNTINWERKEESVKNLGVSINLLGKSINDLSNLSRGLNSDIIIQQGLIKALIDEMQRIEQVCLFKTDLILTGNPIYLDAQKELIIFRIIQESFNNIIKHAKATQVELSLHYDSCKLYVAITDNGNGFDVNKARRSLQAGLKNMETRIKILNGTMAINSLPRHGTTLSFTIPIIQ